MKTFTAAAVAALLIGCIQSALAFSTISKVDHWDADRLDKVGIKVRLWTHKVQGEDPPLEWVQLTFDCSSLPKKQDVVITAWVISERRTVTALRAERSKKGKDSVSLLFTVKPEYRPQSRLDILIWKDTPDGGKEAHGYMLSMKRIIELARDEMANKGMKTDRQ